MGSPQHAPHATALQLTAIVYIMFGSSAKVFVAVYPQSASKVDGFVGLRMGVVKLL